MYGIFQPEVAFSTIGGYYGVVIFEIGPKIPMWEKQYEIEMYEVFMWFDTFI